MTDNHRNGIGAEAVDSPQDVLDEGTARQGVEHFREGGLHPRALAGRQNHNVQRHPSILSAHPVAARPCRQCWRLGQRPKGILVVQRREVIVGSGLR